MTHATARRAAGFTLVEALAVLLIIGLAAGAVVLALPPAAPSGADETKAFVARARLLSEAAVMEGRTTGVRLTQTGYAYARRAEGEWSPIEDQDAFAAREWGERVSVEMERDGALTPLPYDATTDDPNAPPPTPQIRFDPTGMATPFRLRIDRPDGSYVIDGGADGALSWSQESARG
ncbi:MAG: type II secretion system minor pseudopilin GspH [Caulobacterales bacterium]|nr:type II secretion system minor pseudopilin GspH [Caulobacterales bacterium]